MNDTRKLHALIESKKGLTRCVKLHGCTAAKHKIILSWPKGMKMLHYI